MSISLIFLNHFVFVSFSFNAKSFPFDTKTPIGYVVGVILEYGCAKYMVMFIASIACFAIGAFLFAQSLIKDIQRCLKSRHISAKSKDHPLALTKELIVIIQYYSDAIQLSVF